MASRSFMRYSTKGLTATSPVANQTPADGQGFDTRGLEAAAFIVSFGSGGSQGTGNLTLQHSDTTDVNASYAAIPDAQIAVPKGQTLVPSSGVVAFSNSHSGSQFEYHYLGVFRYLRATISGVAGTPNYSASVVAVGTYRRHING